jgi:hypothetical protein
VKAGPERSRLRIDRTRSRGAVPVLSSATKSAD